MKFFLFVCILIFNFSIFSQDSFEEIIRKGTGHVTVNYRSAESFIFKDQSQSFVNFLENVTREDFDQYLDCDLIFYKCTKL